MKQKNLKKRHKISKPDSSAAKASDSSENALALPLNTDRREFLKNTTKFGLGLATSSVFFPFEAAEAFRSNIGFWKNSQIPEGLFAWGENGFGRIGDSSSSNRSAPIQIDALTNWTKISAGGSHTAAIKTDGTPGARRKK